jgi:hypothetical protein
MPKERVEIAARSSEYRCLCVDRVDVITLAEWPIPKSIGPNVNNTEYGGAFQKILPR